MKGSRVIMVLCTAVLLLCPAFAVQIFNGDNGLTITYPQYSYYSQDTDFTFFFNVYDTTSGLQVTNAECYLLMYMPSGNTTANEEVTYNVATLQYDKLILKGNYSVAGMHKFLIRCNTTAKGGFASDTFTVNYDGVAPTSNTGAIVGLAIFTSMFILSGIYLFMNRRSTGQNG